MPILRAAGAAPHPSTSDKAFSDGNTSALESSALVTSTRKIPTLCLDVDAITDAVAAKLAISFLGHVLFLKNQIPLPVVQLSRIPSFKSSIRAANHRTELLNSFDILTSHLNTTFTALSTALELAKRSCGKTSLHVPDRSQAYLAILVGPSMTASRAKVVFAVDGFETKVWGEKEATGDAPSAEDVRHGQGKLEHLDEDSDEGSGEDDGVEFESDEDEYEVEGDSESSDVEDTVSEEESEDERPPSPALRPPPTRAEEERALQAVERLLARTLAAADAEGNGMNAEIASTQTHILLRAPRRFSHPAWVPRQNITRSMEAALAEFRDESEGVKLGKAGKKGRPVVEGVWVTDRHGLQVPGQSNLGHKESNTSLDELDDMIWWSWEGKIIGFSEW